jgi:hypothetical protein
LVAQKREYKLKLAEENMARHKLSMTLAIYKAANKEIKIEVNSLKAQLSAAASGFDDKSLENATTSYKERLCILTSKLDALKKELTFEQGRRRNIEAEFNNTKEYMEKLLVDRRKSESLMVQLSTNAHYDVKKLVVVVAISTTHCAKRTISYKPSCKT